MKRIVLDTNCLIASLSCTSRSYSDDKHFEPLRNIGFPKLLVLKLMEFVEKLKQA